MHSNGVGGGGGLPSRVGGGGGMLCLSGPRCAFPAVRKGEGWGGGPG